MSKDVIICSKDNLHFYDIRYPALNFAANTFTFITGKSGCGKSTYLKLLNGLIVPPKDTLFFKDIPIENYDILDYRRKVLLIPQNVYLLSGSIIDNFSFYYENREEPLPNEETLKNYLSLCCIDKPLNESCDHLSGGERQRIFLAIFLSFAKEVVLLDEPTAALDEKTSTLLMKNLRSFCAENQITAICVSHNQTLVDNFAYNIIKLGEKL